MSSKQNNAVHICVCICTCFRPQMLGRVLESLRDQRTEGLFTYSIAVADNDASGSAQPVVEQFAARSPLPIHYCIEPNRGIARARNAVVRIAKGDYLALIDDDELADPAWLLSMYRTLQSYGVDGVLGPVLPHFDQEPPAWLLKSGMCDREVKPTGAAVLWWEARTGNVLIRQNCIRNEQEPFDPRFQIGEDQDFFRRRIEQGCSFVWCAEGVVRELVSPARWRRMYWLERGLLRGRNRALQPDCGPGSVFKSVCAAIYYLIALPFAQLAGHHRFVLLLVKLCDHLGKLLGKAKLLSNKTAYLSEYELPPARVPNGK